MVTGISRATGWVREASAGGLGAGEAGAEVVVVTAESASFKIGAIKYPLRKEWTEESRRDTAPLLYLFMVGRVGRASYSTQVLRWKQVGDLCRSGHGAGALPRQAGYVRNDDVYADASDYFARWRGGWKRWS